MSSQNVSFDKIPGSIRKPGKYFEFNTKLAVRTLPNNKMKMLLVGQRLAAGTVAEKVVQSVFSDKKSETYFGAGSMMHLMVRAAIKANPYLDLTCITLDDAGAGVAASRTVTLAGTASESGGLTFYIANQTLTIAIANADDPTVRADAVVAQAAKQPALPVTITNVAGVLTFTAKNKGLCGNDIAVGYKLTNASPTTVVVGAMSGGLTDPTLQDALDIAFPEKYDIIVTPYNNQTDLVTFRDQLDLVSGPLEQRPGRGFYAMAGVMAAATTLAGQINHGRMNGPLLRYTTATARQSMPYEIAAAYGAVLAGEEDPARPLNTLELKGIAAPDVADRLSRTEQESLLYNGVAPLEVGPGEKVQIVRAITTYVLDGQGIEDESLLDTTTIATLDYVRKASLTRIALRFPREKLSSKTPPRVRDELKDVLFKLEELEIVEDVEAYLPALIVERDLQGVNQLNAKIPTDVVNGLHVFAARIDLLL